MMPSVLKSVQVVYSFQITKTGKHHTCSQDRITSRETVFWGFQAEHNNIT